MKTVMKKIFSLMLVAVLLVSAVPFAASAAEVNTVATLVCDGTAHTVSYARDEAWTSNVQDILVHWLNGDPAQFTSATITKADGTTAAAELATAVAAGDTVQITLTKPVVPTPPPAVTHEVHFSVEGNDNYWWLNVTHGKSVMDPGIEYSTDYTYLKKITDSGNRAFKGWALDPDSTIGNTLEYVAALPVYAPVTYYAIFEDVAVAPPTSSNGNGITNKDNTNKVYLHVYLNGNASVIQLTKDITEHDLLKDDKTSNGEIWSYLTKNYYGPKDAALGVQIDGLYVNTGAEGTFPQNYYTDNKVSELNNISTLLDSGYVHINVMMKNVAVSSNSGSNANADSSNPKTGDMIFAPVAVLGLSASALAVLFFLNKKRAF